jgi:HSP20 family protein
MSILKRNGDLFPAMPGLFNDFLTRDFFNWGLSNNSLTNTTIPAVNIRETKDSFVVEMAAPGMSKKDFRVELDGNMLTISSEKSNEQQDENENERYSRKEFSYQSFQRTFNLPKDVVDAEKIEAKYQDGVLHLVVPKREEAKQKPPRMININ